MVLRRGLEYERSFELSCDGLMGFDKVGRPRDYYIGYMS